MEDYCMQDCITTAKLFEFLEHEFDYKAAAEAVRIENRAARILGRQEQWGVAFDVTGASQLYAKLAGKQQAIARELKDSYFKPFYLRNGPAVTPKRSMKYKMLLRGDVTEGAPYVKIKLTEFNPGSRQHIYKRLMALYGWKPTKFTPSGEPMVDETVLQALPMPPAKLLTEYLLLEKRLGQIAEGNQAWLKQERDGRIHGRVKQNGTRTTRASHVSPNMGQVPKVGKEYGAECRSLFGPSVGRVQVGSDLSGIEMRALGHYLGAYDGGAFGREAVEGDVHSLMMKAIGFNSRDITKTAEYAYIYGAGDPKLGEITLSDMTEEERAEVGKVSQRKLAALGRATREKLQKGLNGMEPLVNACHTAAERGWMRTLDNRRIAVPSKHSSLNTLLQAMGGVLAKQWMIELDDMLIEAGINPANTWYVDDSFGAVQMLWVHDEVQLDVKQREEDRVARIAEQAAAKAGEHFKLRVPVAAESKIGSNWRECH